RFARWRVQDRQDREGRAVRRGPSAPRDGTLSGTSSAGRGPGGSMRARPVSGLPDFPWDLLEPAKALAARHPDGIVDLSIGTPVDPVPELVQRALAQTTDTPGYPLTAGSSTLRAAIREWASSACGADPERIGVLPTIGSKELVAWLPTLLGLG